MRLYHNLLLICFRSLRSKEKRIHRQLYLAMIIQIVIRLIINTDQYITRIGTIIEGSDAQSSSNDTEVVDTSETNNSYTGDEEQRIIRGIDNTVSSNHLILQAILYVLLSLTEYTSCMFSI